MARITVEDCIEKIPNHFELVLLSVSRCRSLYNGATPLIEHKNKYPLIALREIADSLVQPEELYDEVVGTLREVRDAPDPATVAAEEASKPASLDANFTFQDVEAKD
ncbi:MAG: DNA-directed RNA polymerase subunit omega [Alphaproteobacteria bacterium]|nr:DNA-directed RNA polymerase subunit omega [Alphaproteobacteria bacterium]